MLVWAGCGAWTTGLLVVVEVVAVAVERVGVRVAEWVVRDVDAVRDPVADDLEREGALVVVEAEDAARSSPPCWAR